MQNFYSDFVFPPPKLLRLQGFLYYGAFVYCIFERFVYNAISEGIVFKANIYISKKLTCSTSFITG